MKIEYRFNPPIYILRHTFVTAGRYLSPIAYKITFTVWGNLPPPVAGERGKNTVAGLRVK